MMKYLIETTEIYRVSSEEEVDQLIEESKHNSLYELNKYSRIQKEKKQKGEVIESWYRVTLNKKFAEEKEPELSPIVTATYIGG